MSDLNILDQFSDYFYNNIFLAGLKWLGWNILRGLGWIVMQIEDLVTKFTVFLSLPTKYGLESFFFSDPSNPTGTQSANNYKLFLVGLLTVVLLVLGIRLMIPTQRDSMKFSKIPQNLVLAIVITISMSGILTTMTSAMQSLPAALGLTDGGTTVSVLAENLIDLRYLEENDLWSNIKLTDGKINTGQTTNSIMSSSNSYEKIRQIDILARFDADSKEWQDGGIFTKEIHYDDNDNLELVDIEEVKVSLINLDWTSYYYRYNYNFLIPFLTLICVGLANLFVIYKIIRVSIEILAHKVILPIQMVVGLGDGRKTWMVIQGILAQFLALAMAFGMLFLYRSAIMVFVSSNANLGVVFQIICTIVATMAVIDGPNIIERLIGVDAGIKSGYQALASAYHGMRTIQGIGKGAAALAGGLAGGAANVALAGAAIAGTAAGRNQSNSALENIGQESNQDASKKSEAKEPSGLDNDKNHAAGSNSANTDTDKNNDTSADYAPSAGAQRPQESGSAPRSPDIDNPQESGAPPRSPDVDDPQERATENSSSADVANTPQGDEKPTSSRAKDENVTAAQMNKKSADLKKQYSSLKTSQRDNLYRNNTRNNNRTFSQRMSENYQAGVTRGNIKKQLHDDKKQAKLDKKQNNKGVEE